jgi:intein-encoded DNA endonuclease-like protein
MQKFKELPRVKRIENSFDLTIGDVLEKMHWGMNLTHSQIGQKLKIPRATITRWFKMLGIKSRRISTREKRLLFNEKFFDKWSPETSYLTGLMLADGYVSINPRGSYYFGITSTDQEIVEKVKKMLDSRHKIGEKDRGNPRWKKQYVLQIGSKHAVKKLNELGVVPRKSFVLKMPDVPSNLMGHFIRGYFDGDGSVWCGYHYKKERKKPTLSLRVKFTSVSQDFLQETKNKLSETLSLKGSLLFYGKAYRLHYGAHDAIKLYKFMYRGCEKELFLERKKKVFEKFIKMRA